MRRGHQDEADEEVGDRRAAEDEAHVQGDADRGQDAAGDDQAVDGPKGQPVEDILDGRWAVEGQQKDRNEASDEEQELARHHVHERDATDVGLLGAGIGPVSEDRVDGHAAVEDDRAEHTQAEGDGNGLGWVEAAGKGNGRAHPARQAGIGWQIAAGGDETEVRDVDGRADERALSRVAQDQADEKAGHEGPIEREERQPEEPRAVGQVVAEADQSGLPDAHADRVRRGHRGGWSGGGAKDGDRRERGEQRHRNQAGADSGGPDRGCLDRGRQASWGLPVHPSPPETAPAAHLPESSEPNGIGRSSATIWISTRVPSCSSSRSSRSSSGLTDIVLWRRFRPGPKPIPPRSTTPIGTPSGRRARTVRGERARTITGSVVAASWVRRAAPPATSHTSTGTPCGAARVNTSRMNSSRAVASSTITIRFAPSARSHPATTWPWIRRSSMRTSRRLMRGRSGRAVWAGARRRDWCGVARSR